MAVRLNAQIFVNRKSQAEVDPLLLKSSSTLGSGKPYTHAHRLALAEDLEVRRAMPALAARRDRAGSASASDDDDDEMSDRPPRTMRQIDESGDDEDEWGGIGSGSMDEAATLRPLPAPSKPAIGSALQRKPDGTIVKPKVVPRKPKKRLGRTVGVELLETPV